MEIYRYKEKKPHGSGGFPVALYFVDENHPQFHMPMHWHTETELIYIIEGEFSAKLNSRAYCAKKGETLLVGSGVLHSGTPARGCVYACIVFDFGMLQHKDAQADGFIEDIILHRAEFAPHYPAENSAVNTEVKTLVAAMQKQNDAYRLAVTGGLYRLVATLYQNGHAAPQSSLGKEAKKPVKQLKSVIRLVEREYHEKLTLEDMADTAGMSPKYFCRFFKQMTGQTPVEYLNAYRIEQACRLLAGGQSVTEAAFNCGFNDLSYFISTFKRHKNTTPGRFARQG